MYNCITNVSLKSWRKLTCLPKNIAIEGGMTKELADNILAFFLMLPKNYPSNNILNSKKLIEVFQIIILR